MLALFVCVHAYATGRRQLADEEYAATNCCVDRVPFRRVNALENEKHWNVAFSALWSID